MIYWILYGLIMVLKLGYDYHQHIKGKRIDHDKEAGILGACCVVLSLFMYPFWLSLPMLAMLSHCIIDMGMGLLLTRNPFYLGESAKLDRLQKKYPILQFAKYILTIGLLTWYILY